MEEEEEEDEGENGGFVRAGERGHWRTSGGE